MAVIARLQVERLQRLAGHDLGGDAGQGLAQRLGDEGHGPRSARIDFQHVDLGVGVRVHDGELHVHQAMDLERLGQRDGLRFQFPDGFRLQREGRQRAGRVARVHAGLFDVFHDAGDEDVVTIGQGVGVDFDGRRQVLVDQDRAVAGHLDGFTDVARQLFVVADDLHGAATQHVGRADDDRITDLVRRLEGFFRGTGNGVDRLGQVDVAQQVLEALTVFGQVDSVGRGAEDRNAFVLERLGQLQRRLAAELHDDAGKRALGLFDMDQLQHVFGGQRFEIEAIGGVVVGRHGFRVAVDHDGFKIDFLEGESGVAAAIVELDALADPVRAATQDDRFLAVRRCGFAFRDLAQGAGLVGRVHVGGVGGEFGGAGVDALEDRANAQ